MRTRPRTERAKMLKQRRCPKCNALLNPQLKRCKKCSKYLRYAFRLAAKRQRIALRRITRLRWCVAANHRFRPAIFSSPDYLAPLLGALAALPQGRILPTLAFAPF